MGSKRQDLYDFAKKIHGEEWANSFLETLNSADEDRIDEMFELMESAKFAIIEAGELFESLGL